jgi:hypothetical protein
MRIHTDTLQYVHLWDAARAAGVELVRHESHNSRTHSRAFEVSLRGDSRRRPNFYNGDGSYAATWDQWGIFLGHLFRVDPDAVCGSAKYPVYNGADNFNERTADRFAESGRPDDEHGDHTFRFAGVPREQACTKCTARFIH